MEAAEALRGDPRSPRPARVRAAAWLIAAAALLAAGRGWTQSLQPSALALRLVSLDEPLDLDVLIEASLTLSGADGPSLAESAARLRELTRGAGELATRLADPRKRGEAVLAFLHERVLTGYVEEQTRIDVALATGRYNCVSSAVLYMILARAAGLSVVGVRTHDHAFCAVRIDGGLVDVETTNVYGFDPGSRREFHDQFGRVTGFSYVAANRDPTRVESGERGLLALIPQNLASVATQQRRFDQAVAPAVDGYALARDEESRSKLVVTISNLASWLGAGGRFSEALALLDKAGGVPLRDPRLSGLQRTLVRNEVAVLLRRGELESAIALADRRLASGEMDASEWRDLMVSAAQLRAQSTARLRGPLEALRLVQEAIGRLGRDTRLAESERVYRHNFEAEAHNAMVAAFNQGRTVEARAIVERALEQLPDSARLRGDLAALSQGMEKESARGGAHGQD
jgi:tetratricopeptide (TPR) repeat protein